MTVQVETTYFVVGMFVFCGVLLLVDWLMKKCYRPYMNVQNHETATRVGVVSTEALREALTQHNSTAQKYEQRVRQVLRTCYDKFNRAAQASGTKMEVVSGWTDEGVNAIAYQMAKDRQWKTEGVACKEAVDTRPLFACDKTVCAGTKPGDENKALVKRIDMLVLLSDNSNADDPYEALFREFKGMKFRFDISPDTPANPQIFNTATIMDDLDTTERDKDK